MPPVASQDAIGEPLVVEIHVPLNGVGGIPLGDPGTSSAGSTTSRSFSMTSRATAASTSTTTARRSAELTSSSLPVPPKTSCYASPPTSPQCPASRPVPSPWSLTTRAMR